MLARLGFKADVTLALFRKAMAGRTRWRWSDQTFEAVREDARRRRFPRRGAEVRAMMTQYLTTTDLACLCGVEPDTVRAWSNRRGLPHFRTAGKHRRFKPREVVPWLREHGYDVPARLMVAARADAARAIAEQEQEGSLPDVSAEPALPGGSHG
jgi:excisionase family DNA binding protein